MRAAYRFTALPCILLLSLVAAAGLRAQVIPDAVVVGAEFGTGTYIGEFNSLQYQGSLAPHFGIDYSGTIRYNFAPSFSLVGVVGRSNLSYGISDANRYRYANHFFGLVGDSLYPGTQVRITGKNKIKIDRYMLMARSHFSPESRLVPYFTLGLGLIDFNVTNDSDQTLPMNVTGDYEKLVMVMPVGGGLEYHLNDRVGLYAQGLFYVNSTDYLDGYAHYLDYENGEIGASQTGPGVVPTPSDYFMTLTLGLSVTLYKPETEPPPPPPEPLADRPPTERPTEPTPDDTSMYEPPQPLEPESTPAEPAPAPFSSPDDTDGDGLRDHDETNRYMTDPLSPDSDGDNLSDADEIQKYNTSPNNKDTDSDGLTDGAESVVYNTNPLTSDSDSDGLKDGQEIRLYKTDPNNSDTDKDQLRDGVEVTRMFTNPLNPDSDGDTVLDGVDQCPLIAGDPANHGCPKGMPPTQYSEQLRSKGPLAGLPETPEQGDRTDFSGIYFRVNSDDFDLSRPETMNNLGKLLSYMRQCEEIGVVVEGHTSSEGNPRWNQQLSEKRARRVRDWLLANGISSDKILGTVGYGSQLPKIPEPVPGTVPPSLLEQIRRQNRRITTMVQETCR